MRRKHIDEEQFWKIFMVILVCFSFGYLIYAYYFSPMEYRISELSLSWNELLLIFSLAVLPGIISRFYANLKTSQVEFNLTGFLNSFRDEVHGTYAYWLLLFVAISIWNYLISGKYPWEWGWW